MGKIIEITCNLTSRGYYTWNIKSEGKLNEVVAELKKADEEMRKTFPDNATRLLKRRKQELGVI